MALNCSDEVDWSSVSTRHAYYLYNWNTANVFDVRVLRLSINRHYDGTQLTTNTDSVLILTVSMSSFTPFDDGDAAVCDFQGVLSQWAPSPSSQKVDLTQLGSGKNEWTRDGQERVSTPVSHEETHFFQRDFTRPVRLLVSVCPLSCLISFVCLFTL